MRDIEDEDGFAHDAIRLFHEPQLRATLIENGFENILRYKPETMIARYLSLYERILSQA
jgi:glycosyltransferase involved in cell wall biosynthesis